MRHRGTVPSEEGTHAAAVRPGEAPQTQPLPGGTGVPVPGRPGWPGTGTPVPPGSGCVWGASPGRTAAACVPSSEGTVPRCLIFTGEHQLALFAATGPIPPLGLD